MEMTRRGFLKLIAASAAAAAMPSVAMSALIDENKKTPIGYISKGYVRELKIYDIETDLYTFRYDVCDGKTHLNISFRSYKKTDQENRKTALKMLLDRMKEEGMKAENLIKLPIPKDMPLVTEA